MPERRGAWPLMFAILMAFVGLLGVSLGWPELPVAGLGIKSIGPPDGKSTARLGVAAPTDEAPSGVHGLVALGRNEQGRQRFQVEGGGPVLVALPAGRFKMGSPDGERGRDHDETLHEVVLNRAFLLGEAPVTQAEYAAIIGGTSCQFRDLDAPVEQVSWYEAIGYCNALSRRLGLEEAYVVRGQEVNWKGLSGPGFRLPTEAEWEYACRAGGMSARFGPLDSVAWYLENSGGRAHGVRRMKPNAWGLHDMLGNVWEWCWDRYGTYPRGGVSAPAGPDSGELRVARGGSWGMDSNCSRAASRSSWSPGYRNANLGFRVARSLR